MAAVLVEGRDEVTYVGTPEGIEARLVPQAGIEFRSVRARGFDRSKPWMLLTSTMRIMVSAVRAWSWMGRERPDVVVGFGGYVCIPVSLAALARRVPLVLHEQNSVPGMANRFLGRWARAVAVTYPESVARLPRPEVAVVTGNPVRPAVLDADREAGRLALGLGAHDTVLLVFGGSRGARHINEAVVGASEHLMRVEGLRVVHVTGPAEAESVRALLAGHPETEGRWRTYDYLDDMGSALAAADLVVARAGATSIAEITALGAPSLLVPYPYATDDHQTGNAATLVEHGAAAVVADRDIDSPVFVETLLSLLGDAAGRATMSAASRALGRPDAATHVARVVRGCAHPSIVR